MVVLQDITDMSDAIVWMDSHLCRNDRFLGLLCNKPWASGRVFVFLGFDLQLEGTKPLSLDRSIVADPSVRVASNGWDAQRATETFILSFLQSSPHAAAIFMGVVSDNPSIKLPFVREGGEAFTVGPVRTQYWDGAFRDSVHNFLFVNSAEASIEKIAFCLREANVWPKVCVLVLLPEGVSDLVHGMMTSSDQLAHLISDIQYVVFDAFDFTEYAVWCAPGLSVSNSGRAELGRKVVTGG